MIQHFKQAMNLIKQEKLFSSIYIIGTGLSITIVMVLSIVFYIRVANIYPETNRDRMLIVQNALVVDSEGGINLGALSPKVFETCFHSLHNTEAVSAVYESWGKEHYLQPEGSKEQLPTTVKYVDNDSCSAFFFV